MDKVLQESEKQELNEALQRAKKPVPMWVYSATTFAPYLAIFSFILCCIFFIYSYGLRFGNSYKCF